MSGKAQTNWLATVLVAGICAAIGFGAVYVMTGGGDNQARLAGGGEVAAGRSVSGRESAGATTSDAVKAPGKPGDRAAGRPEEPSADEGGARAAASGAGSAFKGPNGEPLNRGAMTTFVFKKTPMDLPDDVTFNDKAGQAVGLDQFAGKVVLLNLWATWCAPCRKEMPDLDRLQADLGGDRFEVVAVSLDRGSADKARAFLNEIGVKRLRFFHDPEAKLGFKLMAIGMPTTLLIDPEGREIGRLVGPAEWHSEDAKKLIRSVLAAQAS
jgi:thiol-disulfide isomerase/thioredoxin